MSTWTVRVMVMAVVVAALALSPTALAKDGVRVSGKCSKASTSKLKLSREDAGTEVEFEVDQNRNGVRWRVVRGSARAPRTGRQNEANKSDGEWPNESENHCRVYSAWNPVN